LARIYLSSTYIDLREHREAVYKTLRRLGHEVFGMEDYAAADQLSLKLALDEVASCDAFVSIVAWRYGYIPERDDSSGLSITDMEYRHALRLNKPCFVFLLDPTAPWPPSMIDEGGRIKAFREELAATRVVGFFKDLNDLAVQVATAISTWMMQQTPEPAVKPASRASSKGKPGRETRLSRPRRRRSSEWRRGRASATR